MIQCSVLSCPFRADAEGVETRVAAEMPVATCTLLPMLNPYGLDSCRQILK